MTIPSNYVIENQVDFNKHVRPLLNDFSLVEFEPDKWALFEKGFYSEKLKEEDNLLLNNAVSNVGDSFEEIESEMEDLANDDSDDQAEDIRFGWQSDLSADDIISGTGFKLSDSVGMRSKNRRHEVAKIESILSDGGYLDLDLINGPTGYWDKRKASALKAFQADRGLTSDGKINPNGETERALRKDVASKFLKRKMQSRKHLNLFQTIKETAKEKAIQKLSKKWNPFIRAKKEIPNRIQETIDEDKVVNGFFNSEEKMSKIENDEPQMSFIPGEEPKENILDEMTRIEKQMQAIRNREDLIVEKIIKTGYVPNLTMEKDRIESIKKNTPSKFFVKENPDIKAGNPGYADHIEANKSVKKHMKIIEYMAKKHNVDSEIVKAVMWTENARGHKWGVNDFLDKVGASNSIMPMNIQRQWSVLIGRSGTALYNSSNNIEVAIVLLKRIKIRIQEPTIAKIGSVWLFAGAEDVVEYGKYIEKIYKTKPWLTPLEKSRFLRKNRLQYKYEKRKL
jgi:peptidoglycan hydrolase-like protein with peptidoglycan-binding domain